VINYNSVQSPQGMIVLFAVEMKLWSTVSSIAIMLEKFGVISNVFMVFG
jgi:hypothetical protein